MKKILLFLLLSIALPTNAAVFIVPQGGTGASTLTGCLQGNGTGAFTGTGSNCSTGSWSTTSQDYYVSLFRDWSVNSFGALQPTTTRGIYVFASSTIGNGSQTGGLTTYGGSTTTLNGYITTGLTIGSGGITAGDTGSAIVTVKSTLGGNQNNTGTVRMFSYNTGGQGPSLDLTYMRTSTFGNNTAAPTTGDYLGELNFQEYSAGSATINRRSNIKSKVTSQSGGHSLTNIEFEVGVAAGSRTQALSLNSDLSATFAGALTTVGTVGVAETAPGSTLGVSGNASIGTGYSRIAAPTNGLLVQGFTGFGTTSPWGNVSIGTYNQATTTPAFVIATSSLGMATDTQFIVKNGNVGIGTSTPNDQLVIYQGSTQFATTGTMGWWVGLDKTKPSVYSYVSGNSGGIGFGRQGVSAVGANTLSGTDSGLVLTTNTSFASVYSSSVTGGTVLGNFGQTVGGVTAQSMIFGSSNSGTLGTTTIKADFNNARDRDGTELYIRGGDGGTTNRSGGNVGLDGGNHTGTGVDGNVLLQNRMGGRVGVGSTSTPWGLLSISKPSASTTPLLVLATTTGADAQTLVVVDNTGRVGIGTTTPWARLTVSNGGSRSNSEALFAVGSSTGSTARTAIYVRADAATFIGGIPPSGCSAANYQFMVLTPFYSCGAISIDNVNDIFIGDNSGIANNVGMRISDPYDRIDLQSKSLYMGDINGYGNAMKFTILDATRFITMGDLEGNNNGVSFTLDDNNNKYMFIGIADQSPRAGFGTSSPYATVSIQSFQGGAASGDAFAVSTSSTHAIFGIDNDGHRWSSGPKGVISTCGTGTGTVVGDDQQGVITTATAATACTYTFIKAYRVTPVCTVSADSLVGFPSVTAISTTAVTFGISSALTAGKLYYSCSYHQ